MVFRYTRLCLVAAFSLFVGLISIPQANAAEVFDVVNYGAVGDGKTDNQAALTNVFAIASRTPQSTVIFPAGTYLHSGRLTVGEGVIIRGTQANLNGTNAGAQALILTGKKTTVTGLGFNGKPDGDPAIEFDKNSGITIESDSFAGFTNCIKFSEGTGIRIKSNTFVPGRNGRGLLITTSSAVTVQSNTFTGIDSTALQRGIECTGENIIVDDANNFSNLNMGINGSSTRLLTIDKNTFSSCETVISANGPSMSILNNNCSNGSVFLTASNVGTDNLLVKGNIIKNIRIVFDRFGRNTNTTVASNEMESVSVVFFTTFNTNMTLSDNRISDADRVFTLSNDSEVKIIKNVLTRCIAPLNLQSDRVVHIDKNIVTDAGPFTITKSTDVAVTGNQMTNIQTQGVSLNQSLGTARIDNNILKNCGLATTFPPAVIFASGLPGGTISIVGNNYTGNTKNLTYFIDTIITNAHVSGNTTDTTLPTKIGF